MARYKKWKPAKGKCVNPGCKRNWKYPRLFCPKHLELSQPRREELVQKYIQDAMNRSKT